MCEYLWAGIALFTFVCIGLSDPAHYLMEEITRKCQSVSLWGQRKRSPGCSWNPSPVENSWLRWSSFLVPLCHSKVTGKQSPINTPNGTHDTYSVLSGTFWHLTFLCTACAIKWFINMRYYAWALWRMGWNNAAKYKSLHQLGGFVCCWEINV